MRPAWQKYLGVRTPRYTSYPSALQFTDAVGPGRYEKRLRQVGLYQPLSLYIHVPFCRQLCWYCGCNMRVENDYERAKPYVDALIEETRLVAGKLDGRGRTAAVHFGGGTPNYLRIEDLERIIEAVELGFGLTDDVRLAIELDPRLVAEGDIGRLAALGFQRMSLGVQDFNPAVQAAINRVQDIEIVRRCVDEMRLAGVMDVSFDLLYGLPRQTPATFDHTIREAIALAPDRISVFGYAHLPSALPRQKMIDERDLPDAAMRAELAAGADKLLAEAGYCRIGFDHYARPENPLALAVREKRLRRNFQGFTDDAVETMIGFGVSAISYIDGLYAQNCKDIRGYREAVCEGRLPVAVGVERTPRDHRIAQAIADLLCYFEADVGEVLNAVRPGERGEIERSLERFEADGVIRRDGGKIVIADDAHGLSRVVAAGLDPYAHCARTLAPVA